MGLGKTLQVLATSWALMNAQGPTGRLLVRKMLIVAPSSVISNWGKEIKKWIGAFQGECHRVLLPGKSAANLVLSLAACFLLKQSAESLCVCAPNLAPHCGSTAQGVGSRVPFVCAIG